MRAIYFDGRGSRRHDADLALTGGRVVLSGPFGRREASLADVEIEEPLHGAPRILRFSDGASCEVADEPGLKAALSASGWRETAVVRAQRRRPLVLGALLAVIALALAGYFIVLPRAAEGIARRLPPAVASAVSNQALTQLDGHLLQASRLSAERQQAIADAVDALASPSAPLPPHRLLFRSSPRLGANAFALPDGQIVLLDELVALADNDRQIVAVLSHELGHVQHTHGMRQAVQGAVLAFVAAAWFGDVSSLAGTLGALLLESRYSREFEFEADAYAARQLPSGGAADLATMLAKLAARHREHDGHAAFGLLASHPDTDERIAVLRRTVPIAP